jgi:hypothetical protein
VRRLTVTHGADIGAEERRAEPQSMGNTDSQIP